MKTIHAFLFISIALLLQSCGKEKGGCTGTPGTEYFTLTAEAINQTPYFTNKAFDTISFTNNNNQDTLTFVKTKTDTLWFEEPGSGSPDCGYIKNRYQNLHNTYATIKGSGSFDVKHIKKDEYGNFEAIIITFNNNKFNVSEIWLNPSTPYKYKIGDLTVNNKLFKNTIFAYEQLGDTSSNSIIMNKDFGCIVLTDKLANINMYLK